VLLYPGDSVSRAWCSSTHRRKPRFHFDNIHERTSLYLLWGHRHTACCVCCGSVDLLICIGDENSPGRVQGKRIVSFFVLYPGQTSAGTSSGFMCNSPGFEGSSALSVQIIDSKRLLLLSAPKVRKNRFKCSKSDPPNQNPRFQCSATATLQPSWPGATTLN
jgi:hypothetical protein